MKKGKTHVTPSKTSSTTATNKQADILLRQIKIENAVKDLSRSNKKLGIVTPKSVQVSNTNTTTPSTQTTKSKKNK